LQTTPDDDHQPSSSAGEICDSITPQAAVISSGGFAMRALTHQS
jgi:hypothetical protein